jgi:ADP-heptose:LPS heptosyltransferase
LLVRLHGLGDTLMTTPALRALRRRFPGARITMLVGRAASAALADNPHLDDLHVVDDRVFFGPRPLALLRLALSLRREAPDLALLFSRSKALRRFARLAGARRVLALAPHANGAATAADARYELLDNLDLARAAGAEPQGEHMELAVPAEASERAAALVSAAGPRFVVLAPGGGENPGWSMPQKRWPLDRYAALAGALQERLGLPSVAIGGSGDAAATPPARPAWPASTIDATGVSLATSAAIIGLGSLLVTNDSVAMHLALVTRTPFVALFGPTNPRAVLPAAGAFRLLAPEVPCSPCFWQAKPDLAQGAGRGRFADCTRFEGSCLESVAVDDVARAASDLLASPSAAAAPGPRRA